MAIETKLESMSKDLNDIKNTLQKHIDAQNDRIQNHTKEQQEQFNKLDEKYASKKSEIMVWALLVAMLGYTIKLILTGTL